VNVQEAKTHLLQLVDDVLCGDSAIIGKAGKPLVVMTTYAAPAKQRMGGQLRGQITESADCWHSDA
jgi:antitoxin (DNA-binding transcriptional repressor) of toxin-antitoxin stability system